MNTKRAFKKFLQKKNCWELFKTEFEQSGSSYNTEGFPVNKYLVETLPEYYLYYAFCWSLADGPRSLWSGLQEEWVTLLVNRGKLPF